MTKTLLPLALLVTVSLLALRIGDDARASITHPADMACNDCHLARGGIDQNNAKTLVASQEELCSGCHRNALTASHPSGIKPSTAPPGIFPLDWKGDVTCSTCHRVHENDPGRLRVRRKGKELCQSCHDADFFSGMLDGGSSVIQFGHLDARLSPGGDIDNFSIQCLSCHDSLNDKLRVRLADEVIRHNSNRVNHPIGRRYADSVGYGGYRPAGSLPPEIALPDGMLSCISCHEGYSEDHGQLVIDNRADRLCFACHDM